MTDNRTPRDPSELAAAYAINALDPQERAEYEAWLADAAPDARAEAGSFSGVSAALALAAEPVQPSAGLRASLLAQIATTPQLAAEIPEIPETPETAEVVKAAETAAPQSAPSKPVAPPAPAEASAFAPESELHPSTDADAVDLVPTADPRLGTAEARARSRWYTRPGLLLASAAAAAALFIGGGVVGANIARNAPEVAQATALAELQSASDAEQAQASLEGGGTATLIWSLEQRRSAIMVDGLAALPGNKTYQLWYIGEDGPIPDGTFDVASDGRTWRVLDGLMTGGDAVAVTIEPEGGSDAPTSDPVVVINSA